MKKTGAQIIVKMLEMHGVKMVAGIPGGSILPLYDELARSSVRHVLVRQEQAAGFIAQGMTRTNGIPSVCMATSGPGAMNLLTSIADARSDSIPIIAITGQVNTSLIGTDAFQEADTFGLSFPITKHSIFVKSAKELLTAIPEAFAISVNGRPGPVLLDIPRNVQLEECEFDDWPDLTEFNKKIVRYQTEKSQISELSQKIASLMQNASSPVLYLGGGCNSSEAAEQLEKFLQKYEIPVVSSLMGLGAVSTENKNFLGMVGMHGTYAANFAMNKSDLVLAFGVRFDDRATGLVSKFCPNAKIVHIDVDAAEIDKILPAAISIVGKIEDIIPEILNAFQKLCKKESENSLRSEWLSKVQQTKKETWSKTCGLPSLEEKNKNFTGSVNPRTFISQIPSLAEKAGLLEEKILVTTDVGQHQMWAAQYYPVKKPRTFLTSGSLGTMGFGLPAAIGAAFANPEKKVICFSGDGSIMMNIQELATLSENNLNVTVIVFENGTLGMVYQQQKFLFDKNYSACQFASSPDLLKIAEGFGIEAIDADKDSEWYKKAFDMNRKNRPCFVKVRVDPEENVLPFVPGGKANIDCIMN